MTVIETKRRPFIVRLWRSYTGYRCIMGPVNAAISAWHTSRA